MRIIDNPLKGLSRKQLRTLLDAEMIDEEGDFTVDGKNFLWALIFEAHKDRMLEEAKDIVQENREAAIGDLIVSKVKHKVRDLRP